MSTTKTKKAPVKKAAKKTTAKAKGPAKKPQPKVAAITVVEETPAGEIVEVASQPTCEEAAKVIFEYCDEQGISVKDAVKHAKVTGNLDSLEVRAGRDICAKVITYAQRMEREYRERVIVPRMPKIAAKKAPSSPRKEPSASKASGSPRQQIFGVSATAAIRGIANHCGFGFREIRAVLDGLGATWVADGTIRCQMADNGTRRGTPAALTKAQQEEAKKLAKAAG